MRANVNDVTHCTACKINFKNLFFVSSQVGFAIHNNSLEGGVVQSNPEYQTIDAGQTWRRIEVSSSIYSNYGLQTVAANDFYFFDTEEGVVAGEALRSGVLAKTSSGIRYRYHLESDSGSSLDETWRITQWFDERDGSSGTSMIQSLDFLEDHTLGYAVGARTGLLKTEDRGETWSSRSIIVDDHDYSDAQFQHVDFLNHQAGALVSGGSVAGSRLLLTTSGGESWVAVSGLGAINTAAMSPYDSVFAVGPSGYIAKISLE